ncbi:alpha/beta fold hydrolase [Arsenicicoccus piscis]|uniref:alpha/beta fold hydrolase n=1 Tax=Arsenicicoccus piscis TaxID=673954 RepID=UPI001F4C7B5D|nr:alpha/beta fold hydrolase [Arsenicicoccus piscis]MCH8626558.1 alpha/beta fold hydrolase [Arsenicicoccus piscis]
MGDEGEQHAGGCGRPGTRRRWVAALVPGLVSMLVSMLAAALVSLAGPAATAVAAPGRLAAGTAPSYLTAVAAPSYLTAVQRIAVGPEPDGTPVTLDTTIYAPAGAGGSTARHPAVLLAHGLGGSKADLEDAAVLLVGEGFVVLTYSARGFGASSGRVHLDDPAFEVADAQRLVDTLAARPDVQLDGPKDPRVAVVGGSYGGALALMLAATDPRIDADVASITWHDLADALFPQSASASSADSSSGATPGPFKQLWGARFFAGALGGSPSGSPSPGDGASPSTNPSATPAAGAAARAAASGAALCGRYDPTVCRLMVTAMERGTPDQALLDLLRRHSPAPLLGRLTAPTLLVQGQTDTLFGLDQADATARALTAAGTTVAVRWTDGGHDAPSTTADADEQATVDWLRHFLVDSPGRRGAARPGPAFSYTLPLPRGASTTPLATSDRYPGLTASGTTLPISGAGGQVVTPPGGQPASVTTVPGLGTAAASLPTYPLAALPGSSIAFTTSAVQAKTLVVGSPRVRLRVRSSGTQVTLYATLWQVRGGNVTRPRSLVAPLRVTIPAGQTREVTVALPPGTYDLAAGTSWRVLLTTTDSAFANPRDVRLDQVSLAATQLELPTLPVPRAAAAPLDRESLGVAIAIGAALLGLLGLGAWRRHRRRALHRRDDLADVPLVVEDLVKTYKDGHRAVDDVSWRAERGQVVGLLGPNGAGKTTTIRMMLGLIRPDSGHVYVLGEPVGPGSAVLGRVGALVEGPGFLPHLSGRANLHAYWEATGRPDEEAAFEDAYAVAALGGALDRPVRTYSQGMRQRLGIAQAMLGKPELLFLDEPTNGLDPPQIAAMRPILQDYAATGRTVVVSSHLLGEVEQTCSHVVVMHAGRVVAAGAVADLLSSDDVTVLDLDAAEDPAPLAEALRAVPGVEAVEIAPPSVDRTGARVTVRATLSRADVVRAAVGQGAEIVAVAGHRHLEEVFLRYIEQAHASDADQSASLSERLRQVRAR